MNGSLQYSCSFSIYSSIVRFNDIIFPSLIILPLLIKLWPGPINKCVSRNVCQDIPAQQKREIIIIITIPCAEERFDQSCPRPPICGDGANDKTHHTGQRSPEGGARSRCPTTNTQAPSPVGGQGARGGEGEWTPWPGSACILTRMPCGDGQLCLAPNGSSRSRQEREFCSSCGLLSPSFACGASARGGGPTCYNRAGKCHERGVVDIGTRTQGYWQSLTFAVSIFRQATDFRFVPHQVTATSGSWPRGTNHSTGACAKTPCLNARLDPGWIDSLGIWTPPQPRSHQSIRPGNASVSLLRCA